MMLLGIAGGLVGVRRVALLASVIFGVLLGSVAQPRRRRLFQRVRSSSHWR